MKITEDTYRSVRDAFWTDLMVLDLLPEEKLFYLWLITNPHVDPCGCYQVAMRTIEYETGLSRDAISILIARFVALGRILYNEQNKEIILLKWNKNNQGFFNAKNINSIKRIRHGASLILTPEFKTIVFGWIGDQAPTEGATIAPYQAPTEGATIAPYQAPTEGATPQHLTINSKLTTLKSKELQQHACASDQLAEVVEERQEDLQRLFPDRDIPVAKEKLLAFYRTRPERLLDPWLTALKWFQREFKESAFGIARASPDVLPDQPALTNEEKNRLQQAENSYLKGIEVRHGTAGRVAATNDFGMPVGVAGGDPHGCEFNQA